MMKKVLSVLLAGAMVISAFGMSTMAAETDTEAEVFGKSSEAAPDGEGYDEKSSVI